MTTTMTTHKIVSVKIDTVVRKPTADVPHPTKTTRTTANTFAKRTGEHGLDHGSSEPRSHHRGFFVKHIRIFVGTYKEPLLSFSVLDQQRCSHERDDERERSFWAAAFGDFVETCVCVRRFCVYSLTLGHSTTTTLHNIVRFAEYRETLQRPPYMRPGECIRAGGRVRLQKRRRRPFDDVWSKREHHQQVDDDGKTYHSPIILLSFSSCLRLRIRVFVFLGRFRAHLQRVQPFLVEFLFQKRVHVSLSRHLFHAAKRLGDDV